MTIYNLDYLEVGMLNDSSIFHIYILLVHYIIQ
jgi:hypothetical protein